MNTYAYKAISDLSITKTFQDNDILLISQKDAQNNALISKQTCISDIYNYISSNITHFIDETYVSNDINITTQQFTDALSIATISITNQPLTTIYGAIPTNIILCGDISGSVVVGNNQTAYVNTVIASNILDKIGLSALAFKDKIVSSDIDGQLSASQIDGLSALAFKDKIVSSDIDGLSALAFKDKIVSSDISGQLSANQIDGLSALAFKDKIVSSDIEGYIKIDQIFNLQSELNQKISSVNVSTVAASGEKIATITVNEDNFDIYIDNTNNNVNIPYLSASGKKEYLTGNLWYRLYSDGWCEQGGTTYSDQTRVTINLQYAYSDANYTILLTRTMGEAGNDDKGGIDSASEVQFVKRKSFQINKLATRYTNWETKGFIN